MTTESLSGRATLVLCAALALGCTAVGPKGGDIHATEPAPVSAARTPEVLAVTSSPQPSDSERGFALELEQRCGVGDGALARAARELGRRLRRREAALEPSAIVDGLRTAGAPYVWPRAWTRSASAGDRAETLARMSAWLGSFHDGGERRCGVALETIEPGVELAVVLAVDVLADLRPVPVRARLASWVDVEADLLVPAAGAKVVVLGPRGRPRSVPTSESDGSVRARFSADQPGLWLVQVLADVTGGPRPVLEARVFAGEEARDVPDAARAPGEHSAVARDSVAALDAMLNAARHAEGLPPLARDAALDRVASAHAARMRDEQRIAHDVGAGDPLERVGQAGLPVASAGENVAHAANPIRAQRALWSSPSHRANLLNSRFDIVGIGVADDDDGSVWVCELFAELAR